MKFPLHLKAKWLAGEELRVKQSSKRVFSWSSVLGLELYNLRVMTTYGSQIVTAYDRTVIFHNMEWSAFPSHLFPSSGWFIYLFILIFPHLRFSASYVLYQLKSKWTYRNIYYLRRASRWCSDERESPHTSSVPGSDRVSVCLEYGDVLRVSSWFSGFLLHLKNTSAGGFATLSRRVVCLVSSVCHISHTGYIPTSRPAFPG